jgi:flavin reductase (DIM6/NTAB) family NADH-FMN oxidoreductase RutF
VEYVTMIAATDTGIHADLVRTVLRRHAAGVVIVTAPGAVPAGFTATSFTSVSLNPPLVLFCVDRSSSCWAAVTAAEHVGVHLLGAGQEPLARRFATSGVDRFAPPTRWGAGRLGIPVLDGVTAVLACRVQARMPAGDHTVVLAGPVAGEYDERAAAALVYHMGRYLPTG